MKRTIDLDRFRKEIVPYMDRYGNVNISITRLNIAIERSEVTDD